MSQQPATTRPAPTMKSIAAELGLSRVAVSFALNGNGTVSEKTRRKVIETAERVGYKPNADALRLKGQRPLAVGIFALWFDLGVGATKLRLIQDLLKKRGCEAPLYGVGLSEIGNAKEQAAAVAALRREKPRVLVATVNGLQVEAIAELKHYQDEGGILVSYDVEKSLDCDQVIFDRELDSYRTTQYLLELGHREIGIGFHHSVHSSGARVQGYERALREAGLETRNDWCLEGGERDNHAKGGAKMAARFLQLKQRPTAMVMINDGSSFAFLGELQRAGLQCPRDISVVGQDNHPLGEYYPVPLTTITHPTAEIAQAVVDYAISRLDQSYDGPPRRADVQGQLIERASARRSVSHDLKQRIKHP